MQLKWLPTELRLLLMIKIIFWFYVIIFIFSIVFIVVKLIERLKEKREEDKKMKDYRDY